MDNVDELEGPVPTCYNDLGGEVKSKLAGCFRQWVLRHMQKPKELSEDELEEAVDERVSDGWDASVKPESPKPEWPKTEDIYVPIGILKKDLPELVNYDLIARYAHLKDLVEKKRDSRKAGQKAYLRARLNKDQDAVIHDWLDFFGDTVPYTSIDFQREDNKPKERIIVQAYRRADVAWAKACDVWNGQFCVYACRYLIYNACHGRGEELVPVPEPFSRGNKPFQHAPQIYKRLDAINAKNQRIAQLVPRRELRGIEGRALFHELHPCPRLQDNTMQLRPEPLD